MCDFCAKAKSSTAYNELLGKMMEQDKSRMEFSKVAAEKLSIISRSVYSSMSWPVKLVYPMFEARAAYAVPNNYFQNITVDEERLGNSFAHGAMRSVFFAGERMVLFSKGVNFMDGKEFFTSFLLLHLDKGEYKVEGAGKEFRITALVEKPMMNLMSGKTERKKIGFSFIGQGVEGRIVSKDQVASSARFKSVYAKYQGAQMKSGSMDMEGYAVTVPHFSPHPYLLQCKKDFGFETNKDFQLKVEDYFRAHLGQ